MSVVTAGRRIAFTVAAYLCGGLPCSGMCAQDSLFMRWTRDINGDAVPDLCVDGRVFGLPMSAPIIMLSGANLEVLTTVASPTVWSDERVTSEIVIGMEGLACAVMVGQGREGHDARGALINLKSGAQISEVMFGKGVRATRWAFARRSDAILDPKQLFLAASFDKSRSSAELGRLSGWDTTLHLDVHEVALPKSWGEDISALWIDIGDINGDSMSELVYCGAGCIALYDGVLATPPINIVLPEPLSGRRIGSVCAVPDMDGDGKLDLAAGVGATKPTQGRVIWISSVSGKVLAQLPSNQFDIGFEEGSLLPFPDCDGDGSPDILVSRVTRAFGSAVYVVGCKTQEISAKIISDEGLPPLGEAIAVYKGAGREELRVASTRYSISCLNEPQQGVVVIDANGRVLAKRELRSQ